MGTLCTVVSTWSFVYWPIALLLAYVTIAGFYVHQARQRGVGTRISPYIVVGVMIAALVTAAALWLAHHPLWPGASVVGPAPTQSVYQLASPAAAIGLALLVLARVERNRALLAFSLVYLVIALMPINFGGGIIAHPSPWDFLPHLLTPAAVLLLGSLGFAAIRPTAERHGR